MAPADWGLIALVASFGILAVLMALEHRDVLKPRQGAGRQLRRWLKIERGRKS